MTAADLLTPASQNATTCRASVLIQVNVQHVIATSRAEARSWCPALVAFGMRP
jgi:hypothetical protein